MSEQPFAWPDGNVIAVSPGVAWETWPDNLGTADSHQNSNRRAIPANARWKRDEWVIQDHEYAEEEGIWNVLDMLDHVGLKATFICNGRNLERFPEIARECERRGHDMASENYIHEYPVFYTKEEEREDVRKTVAAFEAVLGHHPRGWSTPGHRFTDHTVDLIVEAGYIWNGDFSRTDKPSVIEVQGKPLVTLPFSNISDYNTYDYKTTPRLMSEVLKDEFDWLYRQGQEGRPRMLGFSHHPFLCHGFRLKPIEEVVRYMQGFPKVWFATRLEIAEWTLKCYREGR